ncbi:MAG: hypothetical protein ACRDAM_04905 [Casimicrobium sp.]
MNLHFPLTLRFKLLALAPQIFVETRSGELLLYVRQKLLKFKEEVNVFADEAQSNLAFTMKADRVIDFRARYTITDRAGQVLGTIKQRGMKSIWRAHFDVEDAFGREAFFIEEKNPWVRMINGFIEEIPILGALSGYFLHPAYLVKRVDGTLVMQLKKQPALWEGRYSFTEEGSANDQEKLLLTLSVVMMTVLERSRG